MINEIAKRTGYIVTDNGEVYKGGVAKKAIQVRKSETDRAGITIYPEEFDNIDDMIDTINQQFEKGVPDFGGIELSVDNVYPCIRPQTNEDVVKRDFLDLEIYYRVVLRRDDEGMMSSKVNDGILRQLGISKEELDEIAFRNLRKEVKVYDMFNLLFGDEDDDDSIFPKERGEMNVISNKAKVHGAAVMADKGFMKEVAQWLGGDFYILPSSIHEVIVVPKSIARQGVGALVDMVRDINAKEVRPEEVLSNDVYFYNAKEDRYE